MVTPIFAIVIQTIATVITFTLTFIVYENQQSWQAVGFATSFFAFMTLVLMFVVMCSDPGIQARTKFSALTDSVENPEGEHPDMNTLANSNRSLNNNLPDLKDLDFNDYEETAIKNGFSRLTANSDMQENVMSLESLSVI